MRRTYCFTSPKALLLVRSLDALGYPTLGLWNRLWARPLPPAEKVRRILVVRLDHIGDLLMTTPLLEALRHRFTGARIDVLVGSWGRQILEGNPNVDGILTYDAPWMCRGHHRPTPLLQTFQLISRIRASRYDLALFSRAEDPLALLLGSTFRVPHRVGFTVAGGGFVLTDRVDFPPGPLHQVDINLHLLESTYGPVAHSGPKVFLSTEEGREASRLLDEAGLSPGRSPLVAIHPGTGAPSRLWFPERFAELIRSLRQQGISVLLMGGVAEKQIIEAIQASLEPPVPTLSGALHLHLAAAVMKQCSLVVCLESMAGHLADAVGTPTVVLYSGSTPRHRFRPWSPKARQVLASVECGPCSLAACARRTCMEAITTSMVWTQVEEALRASR